uniref:ANK_REP_REGION domain-containing protein n=1 Tax=Anopheles epiroticus TaxID=199890 RepID=A0A182PTP6_9DIPT
MRHLQENATRTPLHEAAAGGDETKVETLLTAGADRNAKESVHGNTPLHEAAWKGYSRCVKLLCALPKTKPSGTGKGLSIDLLKDATKIKHALHDTKGALHSALLGTRNFGGFSALHLAAQNGHNQSCREILLAGADPDVQNNYGDTPLHTACRYGHAGAIRILLSAKCDFERINLNGDTPLHIACAMGRRKLTRILLESGCRQDTKNAQDETPRDIAQRKNLVEIINILNTPVDLSARRSRERSSSSSQHQRNKTEAHTNGTVRHKSPHEPHTPGHERRSRSKEEAGRKSGRRSNSNDDAAGRADAIDPKHWSPYGCHYFPDPRNFPSPKLETLPKEPLGNGEQYFLDLAGNIRKGPVGVGNTCYCAPFFKHLEQRMNQNRRSIRKYVHRATEKLDSRMTALAMRTDDQIEELTKSMIASRVQCENKRLHLEQWLKRGIAERSTTTATSGGLEHSNSKTKKDEANTNTLTRCRSLELLDDHDAMLLATGVDGLDDQLRKSSTPTRQLFSRSIDFLDAATNGDGEHGHRTHRQQQQELESHLRLLQYAAAGGHQSDALESSNNSNMKNHSESAETPPITEGGGIRISRRPRSSSMSGRESYSYSSDNNKDNDREKPPRLVNGGGADLKALKKRSLSSMPTSSTPTSAISSSGGGQAAPATTTTSSKSEKAKVTERLEELLTKTKKILELEKMTKGGVVGGAAGGTGVSLIASPILSTHPNTAITPTTDNRYILALDKLRDIHHYEPPSAGPNGAPKPMARSARNSPAGYDIAQEMEKITKSLLPAAPVSPEIAKDITTRKERPTSVLYASSYQPQQPHPHRRSTPQGSSPLSTTPLSTMSPGSSLLGGQTAPARSSPFAADRQHLASTNFMDDQQQGAEQTVTSAMGVLMNGFYSNSCFEDAPPSSSNTTIKSAPGHRQHRQVPDESELEQEVEEDDEEDEEDEEDQAKQQEGEEEQEDEQDEEEEEASDLSDRCDLSAMANLAELKELKSRILNGTNWRSQVLQKSVQELLRSGEGGDDAASGAQEQEHPSQCETNRVKYIISKLQQSGISSGEVSVLRTQHQIPPMARCEDFSDSSSEEEEEEEDDEERVPRHEQDIDHDEDCVDGPPLPVNGEMTVNSEIPNSEIGIGTAKTLIQLYEQSSSTIANGPGAIGKPTPNGSSFAAVPKDAYFHELPTRKLLPPPELSSMSGMSTRVHQTARSRNPLPSYLLQEGAGELFQQQPAELLEQQHQSSMQSQQAYFDELHFQSHPRSTVNMGSYPIPADGFLPPVGLPTPVNHHHPHGHNHLQQQQQQQEKLLSTRKYMNPSSAVSLASTGTPSPEFPLYHHQQQQHHHQQLLPPSNTSQQPAYPSAGTASVIGGHSHAMMQLMAAGRKSVDQLSSNGEDSGYVSGKVSEIHIPSGGASPLLSATASNVLIIPPPASSSSPKHFLPYGHHHHNHHALGAPMHQRPGNHGSVVTSIVPPPVGAGMPPPAGLHPTTGQTTAQLHAAVEQKQQALYKFGASSLV